MKGLNTLLLTLFLSISLIAQDAGNTYYVKATSLNLRVEPSTSSKVILKLTNGQSVEILEQSENNWIKVKANNSTGYVYSKYLSNNYQETIKTSTYKPHVRVGAICKDGTKSYATGRGACSQHGGVSYWLYE